MKFFDLLCSNESQKKYKSWSIYILVALVILCSLVGIALVVFRVGAVLDVKAYVEDARLTTFSDISAKTGPANSSSFNVSLAVAFSMRNLGGSNIYYTRPLVADFLFFDRPIYNITVASRGHRHSPHKREHHILRTEGQICVLDGAAAQEFTKQQSATGNVKLEMRLYGGLTVGLGKNLRLEMSCPLTLPLAQPVTGVVVLFHEVDCKPDKPKKNLF